MREQRSNLWRPILDGALRAQALEAVQSIAEEIVTDSVHAGSAHADPLHPSSEAYSLASGKAGTALFYAYLAASSAPEPYQDVAISFVEQAVDVLSSTTMFPSLYVGFTGVAWVAEHLQRRFGATDEEDLNAAIDTALLEWLDEAVWSDDYNLIRGLAGFGVYALERGQRPAARQCLERIIALLDTCAERTPAGIAWHTAPHLLAEHHKTDCPHGYYNLGLAHGMPGIVALLGAAYAARVAVERTRPLLEGAVQWLCAQQRTVCGETFFPTWIAPEITPHPSRLAWCYGDLGLAAAVMGAARCAAEPVWEHTAREIALRAARFSLDRARVQDAGLCHGAAGNAHLFNRFYQASGDERFKEAACFWFAQALAMRRPGEGIGGFRSWTVNMATMQFEWEDDPGFLRGSAGIGLALLAAVSNVEPDWDRVLLTSIPPREATHPTPARSTHR